MFVDKYHVIEKTTLLLLKNKPDSQDKQLVIADGYLWNVEMYPFFETDTVESMMLRYATPYTYVYFVVDLTGKTVEEWIAEDMNKVIVDAIKDAQDNRNVYKQTKREDRYLVTYEGQEKSVDNGPTFPFLDLDSRGKN